MAKRRPRVLLVLPMYDPAGEERLAEVAEVVRTDWHGEEALSRQVPGFDALVVRAPATVGRMVLAAGSGLKVVAGAGSGLDNIDVIAAAELGIPVVHARGVAPRAVAEHAAALLLALAKRLPAAHRHVRAGEFALRDDFRTLELAGRRLGIIGPGHIGREFARICRQGFGMETVAYHPAGEGTPELPFLPLAQLLGTSDFISVHAPLTPATRCLLGPNEFAQVRPGAFLINTARGGVVDTEALLAALQSGRLAGAGLDVFDPEPLPPGHPLLQLPNVVLSPHVAGLTAEAARHLALTVAEQVAAILTA